MNDNVTLIPARRRAGNRISKEENKPKLKVAAYCRVSTDSDEQAGSYEVQVQHYTEYIGRNKDWELAGIYADDGISGTNTKKREGFNEMIDDCMAGKVDMIITKSISRFARNTIDCLKYVRQLKEKNIVIIFEKENINTLEASGELLLTIMASLAQQESASLSQNVKLGLQFRYQEGKVQVNHEHFLGYTKDEEGNLIIDEEEAKTIRRIYREYLEGASFRDIADGLERDKIKTGGKRYKWHLSTIRGILRNEKYMGDALLQKTRNNIEIALADDNSGEMERLNVILKEKQKELVKLAHAKKDYTSLADEIDILRDKKQELLVQRAEMEGVKKRVAELTDFFQGTVQELTEYDEGMVRKYIEQIKVYEDKFTVCFKAKVEIEIECENNRKIMAVNRD